MILDLFYPPTCLHCNISLEKNIHFCEDCLEEFTLLSEEGRCKKCFYEIPMMSGVCTTCRTIQHPFRRFAACFEGYGPARSLLNAFLKGKRAHLSKELASYLILQLDRLNFPSFDLIIAIPNAFFNAQFLIAKDLSKLLRVPFYPALKKEFSLKPIYHLKKKCNIINRSVLLLDTLTTSHAVIRSAANALQDGWCETIYGMTVCIT